ncbi:MAG TPA: hypothetical protein VMX16_15480, partial [Terriglobia bacterium]|nr:hypothetical protein [Terriglobia bacterium]
MTDSRKMMDRLDANPSGLVAGQESNSPATEMRRTTRLSIAVPVTVSGKDAGGETFQEETNTLNINKLGALLALHRRVDIGSELIIENRFLEISLRARVISFQNRMSAADPDHVGIELVELKNIWGIQYPPKDWLRPLQQRNVPDAASPSPTSAQNVIPTSAPATAAPTALQGAAVSPQPAAVTSKPIPVRPATVEIDLGAFEKQAEQSAEALLKTFGAKLAKLGAQMGTRIQSGLKEAADRVQEKEQTLSALDAKLSSLSETLEGTLARAETTLTSAQDIAQRTGQETKLREDEFRLQLQQMLGSALEDFDQRINQRVLASTSAQKEQHSRLQQETVESLNEIQHRLREQAETVSKEVLTNLPVEIERNRGEAMGQISGMAEEKLNAAIQRFEQRLESLASKTQETAAEQMRVETLAKLTPELAARQAEAVDHTQSQVKLTLAAALAEFEQRLQTTATQAQESVSERLKAETLSKLLPELVGRQVEAIDQTRERVRQTVEVSLSDFQQRLRDTATQTQDAAAERVRVEALAKLAPELESRRALAIDQTQRQVKQTLEAALGEFEQRLQATATQAHQSASEQLRAEGLAKLAPELESRRALAIDQTQRQVKQTLEAALGEFEQRLQATATQAHQSASEHLQAEALAKLAPELESRQALAIDQAQRQVKQTLEAALGEFEQRLQATATQAHQSASERLSEEILGRLTPQLEARHSEALQQTNDRVQRDLTNALSSFQEGLRTASAQAHQAAMERLSAGTMAGLSAQLESRQLEVVEQTQRQIADRFQSSLEEFEKRLQSAAAQTESVAVEGLRTEFIAALKPELELCQTDTL